MNHQVALYYLNLSYFLLDVSVGNRFFFCDQQVSEVFLII